MELYLNTYGTYLHKKGDMFEVRVEDTSRRISPQRISSIIISNAAQITTDAIQLALEYNIDILFLNQFGDPYGRIWFPKLGSTTFIRRKLLEIYTKDEGLVFVKHWINKKINNQIEFLKLLLSKRPEHKQIFSKNISQIENQLKSLVSVEGLLKENSNRILGIEGNISRIYFSTLSQLLPKIYQFKKRSSRPAKDAFNAFLNYGFGILYGKVERSLIIAGLDPYIGLLHSDNYNKKSLVFDFIEQYRILIEKPVFYLFSRRKVKNDLYDEIKNGVTLNEAGKKFFVPNLMESFDEIIRYRNKNIKTIDQIQADAHAFANYLIGKRKEY
ncbi:MAG: CRISPR-associated endonuclease Cas1 [Candidatus Cloacimonetes bacterium]|nr:CRISPR-associated endonuclease Cas1 [Candidatus Cloacimonadota bacterium]